LRFWLAKGFCDLCWTSCPGFAIFVTGNVWANKQNHQHMKKTNLSSCSSALVLAAGLSAATFPAAGQAILIDINQSNPSAVQFITTGASSFVNDSIHLNTDGVDLNSYFTASVAGGGAATGSLIPAGTTAAYNAWVPDDLNNSPNNVDLNLYVIGSPTFQNFNISSAAFTGTATVNLSSLLADLPSTGTIGYIYSGYSGSRPQGQVIGEWVVVPEPSVEAQLALGAVVFAGLALVRRARRVAARR
jgi:hypothetical protein